MCFRAKIERLDAKCVKGKKRLHNTVHRTGDKTHVITDGQVISDIIVMDSTTEINQGCHDSQPQHTQYTSLTPELD